MDVYRQAGDIVRAVREGHGTAKALCLRKEMQKKKQTYAVVCETLRHYDLLQDVLEQAEFFQYYPRANRELAVCMAYDVVLGKGVNTNRDSTAQAIQKSAPYLREAYWHVKKHHIIPPRARDAFEEDGEEEKKNNNKNNGNHQRSAGNDNDNGMSGNDSSSMMIERRIPRYARVNTLKIDVESLVERLRRAAAKRARDADDDTNTHNNNNNNKNKNSNGNRSSKGFRTLPEFTVDPIIPSLLVFPPGTDLHAHPAVRSGQLILQDRASCLPVCVLLDAVEVCTSASIQHEKPLEYVVDACAAPGNKTTQIAALGAPHVKVMALERDEKRANLLYKRVQSLGAGDYVNVVHMDFFDMASADRDAAEAILLDPSCSASGVLTRVDVSLLQQRQNTKVQKNNNNVESDNDHTNHHDDNDNDNNDDDDGDNNNNINNNETGAIAVEEQGADFASNVDRVQSLARLQRKLLAHALLSFDNCRTVVYSTCSLHEEENEGVVRQVLLDSRVQARGWTLSHIMPNTWNTRGRRSEEETLPLEYTIRCDPVADATNGFYVARFDRMCTKEKKS